MSDFLAEKRREIEERLTELRPLVDEYHRIEAAAAALGSVDGELPVAEAPTATVTAPKPARAARAPRTPRRAGATTGRPPGRRRGSGTRAAQALALVTEQPGITIPDLAAKMAIKQNYLYRVLPGLEQEGKVHKDGRGWFPTVTED